MQKTCPGCGDPVAYYPRNRRYCTETCRRRESRKRLAEVTPDEPIAYEGNIAYLADVPEWVRMAAFESLVEAGELTEDEIPLAFAAALEPGHLSTRVA